MESKESVTGREGTMKKLQATYSVCQSPELAGEKAAAWSRPTWRSHQRNKRRKQVSSEKLALEEGGLLEQGWGKGSENTG